MVNVDCQKGQKFYLELQDFNYQQDPYASAYPEVVNIFNDLYCTPQHNVMRDNTFCRVTSPVFTYEGYDNAESNNTVTNNVEVC